MLRWRLLLGTLLIAAIAGFGWLDAHSEAAAGIWLMPALLIFTLLATSEMLSLLRAAGMQPLGATVYVGNLIIVLGQWPLLGRSAYGLAMVKPDLWQLVGIEIAWPLPFIGLAIGLFLVVVGEMARYEKPGGVTSNIAAAVFALVYVGLMLGFAVRLRLDWGLGALATWILAVKMGDTGAYTVGRLIGRTKLCPHLSPGKTVEGAVGALIFASIGAWIGFTWLMQAPPAAIAATPQPIGPWNWLYFGVLMGAAGIIGDLAESLLKRDAGRKDSSTWMPGFGGVLDILDSLLLTAPIAWFYWLLGYPTL